MNYLFSVKAGQKTPGQASQINVISIHDDDVTTHYIQLESGDNGDSAAVEFVSGGGLGRCDESMVLVKMWQGAYCLECCQNELWQESDDEFIYLVNKHENALAVI